MSKIKTHNMKRIILFLTAAVVLSSTVNAQNLTTTPVLLKHKTLEKKVEKSNKNIEHERKGVKPKTWVKRGELFLDVDNLGLEQLALGMSTKTVQIFYSKPETVETEGNKEIWIFDHWKYTFEDDILLSYEKIDPIHENPLDESYRSFLKSIELTDDEDKMEAQEDIKEDLERLKTQYLRDGQNEYYKGNLEDALVSFESIIDIDKMPVFKGEIDTLMINYSGIVAREIGRQAMEEGNEEKGKKMYKKAISYYDQLADIGFGGSSAYSQMTRDFYEIGDTLGAIEILKKGIDQYPDSSILVTYAAQAYYLLGENEKGLEFVNQRIEDKPDCGAAYYWKGLLMTNYENVEEEKIIESLELYDKSLEYAPEEASVWYQSGYVNYAMGASYFEQESYEEDADLRKELRDKGRDYYETAAEKLEKAYEVANKEQVIIKSEALDLLKRVYYKLYGGDDERYQSVDERKNNL